MSTVSDVLLLLLLLQIKHLLADYAWQTSWMVANKGIYGHPAGFAHAGLHGALTVLCLWAVGVPLMALLAVTVAEIVVHYHIDWMKVRLVRKADVGPTDKRYWDLTGLDQTAHQLTYVAIAAAALT